MSLACALALSRWLIVSNLTVLCQTVLASMRTQQEKTDSCRAMPLDVGCGGPLKPSTNHFLAKTQFTHEKVLFIHKLWPTPLRTNTVIPNSLYYTSLPAPMYIHAHLFVSFAVFIYYFNCISFAIRLSGRKVAIKLID